jgi:hypothetical protein
MEKASFQSNLEDIQLITSSIDAFDFAWLAYHQVVPGMAVSDSDDGERMSKMI